jgi:hypothetical protein
MSVFNNVIAVCVFVFSMVSRCVCVLECFVMSVFNSVVNSVFYNVIAVCVCVCSMVSRCVCVLWWLFVMSVFNSVVSWYVYSCMVYLSLVISWCVFYGVMAHGGCALNCLLSELPISCCLCHMVTWSQSWVFCFGMYLSRVMSVCSMTRL